MAASDQFGRYEQDLISIIKSAKVKLADRIPISEKGIKLLRLTITKFIFYYCCLRGEKNIVTSSC